MQKIIDPNNFSNFKNFVQKTKSTEYKTNKNKNFRFPWYFKILLYFISLLAMALSILFVLFKGKDHHYLSYSLNYL